MCHAETSLTQSIKVELTHVDQQRIRFGSRSIDLTIAPDSFRHELYTSSSNSPPTDLTYTSLISHQAEVKSEQQKVENSTTGADAALEALQSSLASIAQEKQAKQYVISKTRDVWTETDPTETEPPSRTLSCPRRRADMPL